MTSSKHPIGLYGGTFDPIHNGHLKIAVELIDALGLQGMQLIPNKKPTYRKVPGASAEHRLAMVHIAIAHDPRLIVNDVEIRREGPTYSIDTMSYIRKQIPTQPLCLILGADAFVTMNTWRQWEKIPELVHLVIINRPGVPLVRNSWADHLLHQRQITDSQQLGTQPGGFILQHEMEPMTISATEVREKLKAGKDVSNDVPSKVLRYIQQHHLYTQSV